MNWLGQYERNIIWGLIFGLAFALAKPLTPILQSLVALNLANVAYLLLTWLACHRLKSTDLRTWATRPFPRFLQEHPWLDFWLMGGRTGLSIVLSASIFGFVAAALFLPATHRLGWDRPQTLLAIALCILTVVCCWLMAHLSYALHYAYLYYRRGGRVLNFPEDEAPDLMDFAYFALTIGATFASSDVNITSKEVRRVVLKHTLFAFFFNTAILALTIQFALGAS